MMHGFITCYILVFFFFFIHMVFLPGTSSSSASISSVACWLLSPPDAVREGKQDKRWCSIQFLYFCFIKPKPSTYKAIVWLEFFALTLRIVYTEPTGFHQVYDSCPDKDVVQQVSIDWSIDLFLLRISGQSYLCDKFLRYLSCSTK